MVVYAMSEAPWYRLQALDLDDCAVCKLHLSRITLERVTTAWTLLFFASDLDPLQKRLALSSSLFQGFSDFCRRKVDCTTSR